MKKLANPLARSVPSVSKHEIHSRLWAPALAMCALSFLTTHSFAQTWTGTNSTDWTDAGNWSGGVPANGGAVIINDVVNDTDLNTTSNFLSSVLITGNTLTVGGGDALLSDTVTISGTGNLTNYGQILGGLNNFPFTSVSMDSSGSFISFGQIVGDLSISAGTTTFNDPGSVSGTTTITGGVLNLNTADFISNITVSGGSLQYNPTSSRIHSSSLTLDGGAVSYNGVGNNAQHINGVDVNQTSTINIAAGGVGNSGLLVNGDLTGSADLTVNSISAGVGLVLRGTTSSYTGTLTVTGNANSGQGVGSGLALGNVGTGLAGAALNVNGTLELGDSLSSMGWATNGAVNGTTASIGSLDGSGVVVGNMRNALSTRTLSVGNNNADGNFSGSIVDGFQNTLSFVKDGAGTQILSGTNNYTGTTSVLAGTLQFGNSGALYGGNTASWTAANINVQSGATLALNVDNSGTNGFTSADLGTLLTNISVANTPTEGLQGGATLGFDTSTDNNGFFTINSDISDSTGANGGSIGVTKLGAGRLVLSGNNTYTGDTTVVEGTLRLDSDTALGSDVAGTVVLDGARLQLNNVNIGAEALIIQGNGDNNNGALANIGTSSYAGQITAAGDATINAGGGDLTLSGGLVKDGTTLTLTGGGVITINTVGISGASNNSDLVVDGVTVNLDVDNSYNGPTFILNGATLNANVAGAMPDLSPATRTRVIMDDSGTGGSTFNLGSDQTIASLAGAASSLVTLNSNTLTIGQGSAPDADFAGVISGTGGIDKRRENVQILSGANTYTGDTNIFRGTLRAGAGANGQAFGINSDVTLSDVTDTNLDLNGFSQAIGSLSGGGFNGGNVTLGNDATLTIGGGDNASTIFSGVISGTGTSGITLVGANTYLSLDNQNTYTGATNINAGTLEVLQDGALGTADTGTTVANGATLALFSVDYTTAESLTINGAGVNGGGALANIGASAFAGEITVASNATISAGGGDLTLSGGIIKNGTTLTLNGGGTVNITNVGISGALPNSDLVIDGVTVNLDVANTYNGPTYIRSTATDTGILNANVSGAMPDVSAATRSRIVMDDSGAGGSEFNLGADQAIASLTGASSSLVNLNASNLTIGQDGAPTADFAGVISGTGGLIKRRDNVQILSGQNTFTGDVQIFNGTLRAGAGSNGQAFGDNTAVDLANVSGAILDLNNTDQTIGSLSGGGVAGGNVTLGSGTLTTGGNNSSTTFRGVISGTGGLNKVGNGTFRLTGINSYTGDTEVTDGTLQVDGYIVSDVTVRGPGALSGSGIIDSDVTLRANGSINLSDPGTITGELNVTGDGGSWDGTGTVNGRVYVSNSSTLTIGSGANLTALSGVTVRNSASIAAADVTSTITGSLTYRSSALSTFQGVIAGNSDVEVDNEALLSGGGLILSGANTYVGTTTVTSGYLEVTTGGTLGNDANNVIVLSTGTLALTGNVDINQNVQIAGTGTTNFGASPIYGALRADLNTDSTVFGLVTLTDDASIVATVGSTLTLAGGFDKDGVTATLTGGGTINVDGEISGVSANSDLVVDGATVNLNAANTYNGPTFIVNGGILNTNAVGATPLAIRTALTMDNAGSGSSQLNLIGGFDQEIASLAGPDSTSLVNLNDNTLTIGTASGTTDFAGEITGTGSLIKDGASTQILSGVNSYTGTTTINDGTLQIDGYIESDVTVEGPGTLAGAGTIDANVELTNGGFIDLTTPGVITGTLDVTGTGGSWIGAGEVDGLVTVSSGTFTIGSGANLTAWSGVEVINAASIAAADSTGTITGSLTYLSSALSTFQGVIAGNSDVTVDNELLNSGGGLILSGLNTYVGTTTVTSGYLEVTGAGTLGNDANDVIVLSTGTLALTGDASINQDVQIAGTGTTNFGASPIYGALRADLNTDSTVFGLVTLTDDASIVATVGSTLTLAGGFDKDGVTATLTGGGTINVDGEISGVSANSDLVVDGATVNLNAANTYNGPTFIVNGGILNTNAVGATPLAIRTALTMDNAGSGSSQLNLIGGFDQEIASLTGAASSLVDLNDNTLTIGTAAGTTTFAGVISGDFGTGGITKDGASTQVLSGTNTYTGATQINEGILRAGAAAGGQAFGNLSAVTLANVAGATLDLNNFNQTIGSLAGGGATGGNVTLGTGTLTTGGDNTSTSYAGIISGTGANALIKNGTGTFTLSGASTYTGTTQVNAGILQAGASASGQAFGSRSAVTLADTAGVALDLNGFNQTIGSLSGGGLVGGNVTLLGGTLTIGTGAGTTTFSGVISGSGGITKDLASIQVLSGLNTYTGATLVTGGTLRAGVATSAFGIGSAVTVNSGGTLDLNSFNQTIGSLAGNPGGSVTLGSATLTTGGNNTSTIFTGVISGTGALTKVGTGTFTLAGSNTYTGATAVNAGILQVDVNNALGTNASGTTVANGAALVLNGVNYATAEALTINGTGISNGGALVNIGTSTYAGLITAATDSTINAGGGNLTLTGGLVKNGINLTLTGGGTINVNSVISGALASSDLFVDGVTTNLNGANTYNGATYIRNNGTINANVANAMPTAINRSALIMDDIGTGSSDFNLGFSQSIASLTGAASSSVSLAANTLTIGTTGGSTTFAGVISGTGNLTKDGASTQVLSASNTYTGTTTVADGTLVLSAAERLANASDLVITGGELTFVNVETVDIFTQTGGVLDFDVDHPGGVLVNCQLTAGVDNDVLIATTASLGGTINVNKQGVEFERGESAVLIDTTAIAGITGTPDSFTHDYTDRIFLVVDTSTIDTLTPLGAADTVTLLGTGVAGQNGNLANIAGLNANQMAIANAINTNINLNGNILDTSVEMDQIALFALGDCTTAPGAGLDILSPEPYAGFSDYGVQTIKSYTTTALNMPSFSKDGTARSVKIPVGLNSEPMSAEVSSEAVTSVFAGYSHYSTQSESSINNADYDISSNGGILGLRHQISGMMLGGFVGIDEGDVSSATLNADAEALLVGAFVNYMIKPEYELMVTGGITYGMYEFSGTRQSLGLVRFDDVRSDVFDVHVAIEGNAYSSEKIRVSPFLGFHYVNSETEAFTETGLGALTVNAHEYDAFFAEIGVKSEYQLTKQVSLNGNISYTHNLTGSEKNIAASLGGTPFAVASPGLGNDILTIGLGAQYQVTEDVRLGINYRAEFSTDAEVANGVSVGGSYSF